MERFGARRSLTGEALEPQFSGHRRCAGTGEIGAGACGGGRRDGRGDPRSGPCRARRFGGGHAARARPDVAIRARFGCWVSGSSPTWTRTARARSEQRQQQTHRRLTPVPAPGLHRAAGGPAYPDLPGALGDHPHPARRPPPDDALGPDDRTPAQRLHDAFEEAGRRLLASRRPPRPRRPTQPAHHHHQPDRPGTPSRTSHHPPRRHDQHRTTHCAWPPTAASCPRSSTTTAASSATAAAADSPHPANAEPCSPATAVAPSPAVTAPPPGPKSTTPPTGPPAGTPTSTPWPSPAASTTTRHRSRLAHRHDRRHPTLATTTHTPGPAATAQPPSPPRTAETSGRSVDERIPVGDAVEQAGRIPNVVQCSAIRTARRRAPDAGAAQPAGRRRPGRHARGPGRRRPHRVAATESAAARWTAESG